MEVQRGELVTDDAGRTTHTIIKEKLLGEVDHESLRDSMMLGPVRSSSGKSITCHLVSLGSPKAFKHRASPR